MENGRRHFSIGRCMDFFYIVSDKCTECKGFHDEPQCAAVCPVDCCIDDEDVRESEELLLEKKEFMHLG
jgi:ferredoxin